MAKTMLRLALAYAATYLLWGSTFLGMRLAVQHMAPFPMAASRFLLAGGVFLALAAWGRRGGGRGVALGWPRATLTGAMFFLGTHGIASTVSLRAPSGVVAVLMALTPLWVAAMGWFLQDERPSTRLVLALLLGLAGVAVLAWPGGAIEVVDAAWMVAAAVCWAGGTVLTRRWSGGLDAFGTAGRQMVAGGGLLLLGSGVAGQGWLPTWPGWPAALAVLYLALPGSVVTFTAYLYLMRHTSATQASGYTFVNPLVAVLLGAALAGEAVTRRLLLATPLILVTVWMTLRVRVAAARPPAQAACTEG